MYKTNSANMQGRADRLTLVRANGTEEIQTAEQQRDSLKRAMKAKEIERKNERDPARWRKLGMDIYDLQQKMHAMRPKLSGPKETPQLFVDVAREVLSTGQFKLIMDIALKRHRQSLDATP